MQFSKALKYTVTGRTIYVALSFVINLLMIRVLGAEESGRFFYAIAILTLLILIVGLCLDSGLTYYSSRKPETIFSLTWYILPLLILETVAAFIILRFFTVNINNTIAVVFITGNIALNYFSSFFYALNRYGTLNIIQCIVSMLLLVFLLYCKIYPLSITAIEWVFMLAPFLQALLLAIVLIIKKPLQEQVKIGNKSFLKDIVKYSAVVFVGNILFFLVTRIDYYFVERFCANDMVLSNYIQVSKIGQMLILLPSMLAAVIFPFSSGNEKGMFTERLQLLCRGLSSFFIIIAIGIILCGKWLFPWLLGSEFNLMYHAILWYLPGFFSLSIIAVLSANLAGNKMVVANLIANVIAIIIVITGDVWLIPVLGINGAAAVSSVAYSATMLYLLWIYKTKLSCTITDFFFIRKKDINIIKGIAGN